jgi:hypothetical protein
MSAARLWLLHGLKRSGNHALVHWLRPQLRATFFNNLIPLGELLRGKPMPAPRPYRDWVAAQSPPPTDGRVLASLEDHDLATTPFASVDVPATRLLLLRAPDQLFASRIRKAFRVEMPAYPRVDGPVLRRAVALWKQHARCYLGDDAAYPGRVAILFDRWFVDRAYREAIAAALGVPFDDAGFGRVGGEGGGSSFDGTAFDGRAQEMAVGERVAALEPHERALHDALFADEELRALQDAVRTADPFATLAPAGKAEKGKAEKGDGGN